MIEISMSSLPLSNLLLSISKLGKVNSIYCKTQVTKLHYFFDYFSSDWTMKDDKTTEKMQRLSGHATRQECAGWRWSLLIIRDRVLVKCRYVEFNSRPKALHRISSRTNEGIGSWSYQQKFVRHEYFLTEKGQSLWSGLEPSFLEPLLIKVK